MFYFQQSVYSQCIPVTEELWNSVVNDKTVDIACHNVAAATDLMRGYEPGSDGYNEWHKVKSDEKKKLPAFVYMAGKIEPTKRGFSTACWRKSSAITLNGLVMADFDDLDDPRKVYAEHADAIAELDDRILLTHITPSGHGLRFVFKADPSVGNIADNQAHFAQASGLQLDLACKDSSRTSYAVSAKNILQINLQELWNYENKEFDEKYNHSD